MSYTTDHQRKFADLNFHIENQDLLKQQASGGNSILFSYPPKEEQQYIEKAKEIYTTKAVFIDVSKLLVDFIDEDGWEDFSEYYQDFSSSPHKIFRSENASDPDLFKLIIKEIQQACESDKIPFLIRTGCLCGTGIENINIMDNKIVNRMSHPLALFYPSKIEGDTIKFLNFKPASKYRCVLVT